MTDRPVATAAKLLARMNDPEHQVIEKEFFGLAYGDKGTRKTTWAQRLAQELRGDGQILFAASGNGFVSLDREPALKANTRHLRMTDPREVFMVSKALRSNAKGWEDFTVVVLDDYDSWWMDTLHSYAYEQAGLDPEVDELPEIDWTWYGPPQQAMLNVVKNFYKTPGLHVIITSAEQGRALKGEKNGPDRYTPLLGTKLSAGIGHLAHVVTRFEGRSVRGQYQVEAQIMPTRYVDAKSRLSNLDAVKVDSTELAYAIADWVYGDGMAADVAAPEAQVVGEDVAEGDDDDFSVEDDET